MGFLGGSTVKNSPAIAGDAGDLDSLLGSGRSPEEGNGDRSIILVWKMPSTAELRGYHPQVHKQLATLRLGTHATQGLSTMSKTLEACTFQDFSGLGKTVYAYISYYVTPLGILG